LRLSQKTSVLLNTLDEKGISKSYSSFELKQMPELLIPTIISNKLKTQVLPRQKETEHIGTILKINLLGDGCRYVFSCFSSGMRFWIHNDSYSNP